MTKQLPNGEVDGCRFEDGPLVDWQALDQGESRAVDDGFSDGE
jgi:hypothetical protein